MDFLVRLEQSGFSTWVRGSGSLFSYPLILFLHTVGMAMVAGINVFVDLRILGLAPAGPRGIGPERGWPVKPSRARQ